MTQVEVPDESDGARRWRVLPADDAPHRWAGRGPLRAVDWVEDAIHVAVALLLLVIGVFVLVETVVHFVSDDETFSTRVTAAINGILFVIIVMEILRTVVAHFEDLGLQLKPFLIIGIISARPAHPHRGRRAFARRGKGRRPGPSHRNRTGRERRRGTGPGRGFGARSSHRVTPVQITGL